MRAMCLASNSCCRSRRTAKHVGNWLAARHLPLHNILLDKESQAPKAFDQRGVPITLFFDAKERLVST
jgi:hypothetical protein